MSTPSLLRATQACMLFVGLTLCGEAASTTWNNGGTDSSWSNPANWSNGVPTAANDAVISTQPTDNLIGLDTGSVTNVIPALTFSPALTGGVLFTNTGVEQLTVTAAIGNLTSYVEQFGLAVNLPNSSLLIAGGGLQFLGGLSLANSVQSNSGAVSLGSGASTVFSFAGSTYGHFEGSGALAFSGNQFVFDFTTAVTPGSVWDLYSTTTLSTGLSGVSLAGSLYRGAFTQTTAGTWAATLGGLDWTFTEADGVLRAVPEPHVTHLLAGAAALMLGLRRGRRALRGARPGGSLPITLCAS